MRSQAGTEDSIFFWDNSNFFDAILSQINCDIFCDFFIFFIIFDSNV